MPSLIGHAIVGATAARFFSSVSVPSVTSRVKLRRFYWALTLFCTLIPDADGLSFALGVPYESFFGHRGFFHSILFAAWVGFFAAATYLTYLTYLKAPKIKPAQGWRLVLYFFLVTLSHPVLDAMTNGGHGVAFFSPFNVNRYFSRYRPIDVAPLSITEFFGNAGLRVVFSEFVFLLLPCLLLLALLPWLKSTFRSAPKFALNLKRRKGLGVLALVGCFVFLSFSFFYFCLLREELIPGINGLDVHQIEGTLQLQKFNGIDGLPLEDLPGKRLLVNYGDLLKNNLLNTVLLPARQPWSGSFFPSWLGGVSGRWQDFSFIRIWKTLMGEHFLPKPELVDLLHTAALPEHGAAALEINQLAPTEKYDIAVGDYYLTASRSESATRGRGLLDKFPNSPFWAGYCNSISLAAIYEKEPQHKVRVLNPDGYEVEFYPNDIKALLGISYIFVYPKNWDLGARCETSGPKNEACLDVNPAALVIALTNLIGLAKTSFVIDKEPFLGIQNAPIRKAMVRVINPPYFTSERQHFFKVEDHVVKWLVDVEIDLTVSKIGPLEHSSYGEEALSYRATLGLDQSQNLVGGRWEDPFHHPDFAWGGGLVTTTPGKVGAELMGNSSIEWPIIQALVEQSAKNSPQLEPIQIAKLIKNPHSHGFAFRSDVDGIGGGVSYLRLADPVTLYGRLEGERLSEFRSVELVVTGKEPSEGDPKLAVYELDGPGDRMSGLGRVFFKLTAPGSIEGQKNLMLRLNRVNKVNRVNGGGRFVNPNQPPHTQSFIQFKLPFKQKFDSPLNQIEGYP